MTPLLVKDDRQVYRLRRLERVLLLVGAAGIVLCMVGALLQPIQFYRSYLWSYLYWWILSCGCLGLGLIHHMTGGRWGHLARPMLLAGIQPLIPLGFGFLPLAWNLDAIYPWASSSHLLALPRFQQMWLAQFPFNARAALYFVCLIGLMVLLLASHRSERGEEARLSPLLGGLGTLALAFVVAFAAMDWGMSLDPHWFSSMYGGLFISIGLLLGLSTVTTCTSLLWDAWSYIESADALHDLGKLTLASLLVWAYLTYFQFLITYSGNLPMEVVWYQSRLNGGWQWLVPIQVVFLVVIPFLALLSRQVKRSPRRMAVVSAGIALMLAVHVFWTIAPSTGRSQLFVHWLDFVTWITFGGVWGFFATNYVRRTVVKYAN